MGKDREWIDSLKPPRLRYAGRRLFLLQRFISARQRKPSVLYGGIDIVRRSAYTFGAER